MTDQEGTKGKGVRGKGKLLFLEDVEEGQKLPVENFTSQPSGEHRSDLAHYIGRLARDGYMLPLSVSNWKYMTPNRIQKALDDIKVKFVALQIIWSRLNHYWRDHKHTMKSAGYDPNRSEAQNLAHRPADVVESQWAPLVKMWNTQKNKELAAKNKQNRSKQTIQHTGGSKPHMEYAKEMLAKTGRFPERHEIFRRTRTKKRKTSDPNEEVMDPVAAEQYVYLYTFKFSFGSSVFCICNSNWPNFRD
ncbi:uncharacterized protein LOC113315295 [Papaver somniferum]|uniref:uncharacterized protein LOC113315295 n=1 Tax=Papaver somniferum TaxID=3469 RepID=UPI000E70074B|nr:uncharacterized protein LOC113315295 [Papaver somniferum]